MHSTKEQATGWPRKPMQVKPAWLRGTRQKRTADRREPAAEQHWKNYLAICESLSAALDLYIERLRHQCSFSAYSGAGSVMGRLLHIPPRNEEKGCNSIR
jgi:hypothetical protein